MVVVFCLISIGCSVTETEGSSNFDNTATTTGNAKTTDTPGTTTSATNKAEATQAETTKTETAKPETTKAETAAPVTSKPETTKAETTKAVTTKAETQSPNPVEAMVWIPQTGSKYHSKSSCSGMKNPSQVTKSYAQNHGFTACKKCYG